MMSYKFEHDLWLENELVTLEFELKSGRLDESDYDKHKDRLMDRYDEMVARLDGTYRIFEE